MLFGRSPALYMKMCSVSIRSDKARLDLVSPRSLRLRKKVLHSNQRPKKEKGE
jgi:predicted membrane GTPase involved in stress response